MQGVGLDPALLVPQFPGPAALLATDGHALISNDAAAGLLDALAEQKLPGLSAAVAAALRDGQMRQDRADLAGPRGGTALQVTLIPMGEGDDRRLLLLARDGTLERNLINALMQSRQLFKDLVSCSTDFAWETKPDGRLGFVSPRGALGYTARELEGRHARE
ncbi:MAG: sensor domain-containing diguanylate cyclase, partial [Ferrovibrio sp.]